MTCHLTPTGGDLRANIEGLLKKFRVTKENEKESEIFTLANLDNGCIRKFIVKKVDESAFLASINRRNKEDSKSLTDENENTAVVGSEEGGDGRLLVPPSPTLPRRNVPAQPLANGHATALERKSSSFTLGCDDDSDDNSMTIEEKEDPGVVNPAFTFEEDEDDDLGRGDGSTTSARSSPETSPSHTPKLHFISMSPRPSPRHSPVSHRSGNLSHRSSVSSVRKGILKKSGSSSTINMEMVNLGLQHAAIAAGHAANLNGYQRALRDPYDEHFLPTDTQRFVGPDESNTDPQPPPTCSPATPQSLHSSSEENNYAMQQKSLGGHRVKFILETGKPDHVHGSYDDIRIEKMERERIERIESGKNLEVTNITDRGSRKCLLFCLAMLVLTGAMIVAGLYGSGKFKTLRDYGKGITSGLSGGSGKQPASSLPQLAYVSNAIEGKFKIDNFEFKQELTDVDSEEYKKIVKDLEAELKKVLFPEPVLHNGKAVLNLKIIKFEPGSIKVTFRIGWTYYDEENQQEAPLNPTGVRQIFDNHVVNNSYLYLQEEEYRVPSDSIVIDRLVDKCHNNQSLCSNGCKFSYDDLRFTCTCPDYLYLINTTTCIYPNKDITSTTTEVAIKDYFNKVIQNAGNATLLSIKLEDIGRGIERPPSKDEVDEELTGDGADKPKDGTVDGAASNITSNATVDGHSPHHNATDGATNATLSGIPPASNGTAIDVKSVNGTGVINATSTSPDSKEKTNSTDTKLDQHGKQDKDTEHEATEEGEQAKSQPDGIGVEHSPVDVTTVKGDQASIEAEDDKTHVHKDKGNTTRQSTSFNVSKSFPEIYVSPGTRLEDIMSFTNLSEKNLVLLDLSALRPGDSPGNVEVDELEKSMGVSSTSIPFEEKADEAVEDEMTSHSATLPPHEETQEDTVVEGVSEVMTTTPTHTSPVTERSPSTTTKTTERPAVIINANEIAVDDDLFDDELKEEVPREFVTIPAVPYEGNPIFANKTPPSVRTTTTTTSTTASPPTTSSPATPITRHPPEVHRSPVTQATSTSSTTLEYDTKGEVAPVNGHPSLFDIMFNGPESDVIENETSDDSPSSTTTTTTTSSTTPSTTTTTTTTTKTPAPTTVSTTTTTTTTAKSTNITESKSIVPVDAPSPRFLCREDQVQCLNGTSTMGRCIPRSARCNSVPDCSDGSDEHLCQDNSCFGNFQCQDGECIERFYVCDGVTNCRDGDDELGCESWECKEDELKCGVSGPSPCIPLSLRCDGQPDCADHSDELNCTETCRSNEFRCGEGWCIPKARTCDGRPDCHAGEDEEDCECSGLDETQCDVGGCVPTFHLCDGLRHCKDGSDEWNCVRIDNSTRQLEVRSGKSRWSAVCGEEWTRQWSDLVCELLGASSSVSTEVKRVVESVPRPRVRLSQKASPQSDKPLQYILKSDCQSDSLVHLSCEHHTCGSWSLGDDMLEEHQLSAGEWPQVAEGQWPSLALLLRTHPNKNDTHARGQYCSATIVAPRWILAAYSCLSSKENGLDPSTWAMVSGVASPSGSTEFHYVMKIVPFPGMVRTGGLWTGDAVLLRLDSPLMLGRSIQPVCVPNAPPRNTALCVVAGWTKAHDGAGQSQFLHYLPVPTLALDACNTTHYPGRLNPTHTCVGFSDAQHAPCHGDEGSPLMCRSESGAWRLEGLLTHHARCGRARHPAIFTALHALQPWLSNTIGTPYTPSLPQTTTTTTTTTTTPPPTTTTTGPSSSTTTATTTTPSTTTTTATTTTTPSTTTTSTSSTTTSSSHLPSREGSGAANTMGKNEELPPPP